MDIISIAAMTISAITVVIALKALATQTRQNNLALGVTILRDLEKQFHWSEEMRKIRFELATSLLKGETKKPSHPVSDMLDFLDSISLYHNKGVIDTEMTWTMFYYWFGFYWHLLKEDADYYEKRDGALYYRNLRRAYAMLTKFGIKRELMSSEEEYFSADNIRLFLNHEMEQSSSFSKTSNLFSSVQK